MSTCMHMHTCLEAQKLSYSEAQLCIANFNDFEITYIYIYYRLADPSELMML